MIIEKAYAKINIGLNIVGPRDDGYHNIDTIMQTIELHDVIKLQKIKEGINIICDSPAIPMDNRNTAYKAAELFLKKAGLDSGNCGVKIEIQKNIPSEAGLGGGSSDAAAVLRAMNNLFCTNYGTEQLVKLASEIGSDVPFLIEGGTVRAKGRGEIMENLCVFSGVDIVIVMPGENVSTRQAYSMFATCESPFHPDINSIVERLNFENLKSLQGLVGNTFEGLIFPIKPIIEKTKHDILKTNPLICSMTGSGSAVYGIYESNKTALKAFEKLSEGYETYITKTIGGTN